jgi:mono/diheme cytochrome c family protein
VKHRWLPVLLLFATAPVAAGAEEADAPRPAGTPTFARDVAPILFRHCAACHRPGEVAPFPLLEYRDARKRAGQLVETTATGHMPPWKAVAGHGEFRNENRLSPAALDVLKRWAEAGAPEGDAQDLPPRPRFAEGWQLGAPDLVVRMPRRYEVAAEGPDIHRNFVIRVTVPEGTYVRAVEYRPENRSVVHHAALALDPANAMRERDGKDGAPGFTQVAFPGRLLPGPAGFWVPGKEAQPLPEGVAVVWPKGADLVLQLHLHPTGKPESEQSSVGFHFTDVPPRRSLRGIVLNAKGLDVPAGEPAHVTRDSRTLDRDTRIFGIFPHMHLIGRSVRVAATLPDGGTRSLLRIDHWDFDWQFYHEYASPVLLPQGTRIDVEYVHDNSAANPRNPHVPPQRIVYGEQSTNEMAALLIDTLSDAPPPTAAAPGTNAPNATVSPPDASAKPPARPDERPRRDPADLAAEALRTLDANADGRLDVEEIRKSPVAKDQDVPAVVRRFDQDGDGQLDRDELAEAIRTLRR